MGFVFHKREPRVPWTPLFPGHPGIHAKPISSGRKQKDKRRLEGRPHGSLRKIVPAPRRPSSSAARFAEKKWVLSPQNGATGRGLGSRSGTPHWPGLEAAQGGCGAHDVQGSVSAPRAGGRGSWDCWPGGKATPGAGVWGDRPLCSQSLSAGPGRWGNVQREPGRGPQRGFGLLMVTEGFLNLCQLKRPSFIPRPFDYRVLQRKQLPAYYTH